MKIHIITIGKTGASYLREGIDVYIKRLNHYCKLEWTELKDLPPGALSHEQIKQKEGETILKSIKSEDSLYLLDEKGKAFSSREFAQFLQKRMNSGSKTLVLVVGGAYGFSDAVYERAEGKISFSAMTFSHEMIRLLLVEQLYRGFTILKGESYHHD